MKSKSICHSPVTLPLLISQVWPVSSLELDKTGDGGALVPVLDQGEDAPAG